MLQVNSSPQLAVPPTGANLMYSARYFGWWSNFFDAFFCTDDLSATLVFAVVNTQRPSDLPEKQFRGLVVFVIFYTLREYL